MKHWKEIIESSGYSVEEVEDFLHRLRESGEVNMFGAGPYLSAEFGFTRHEVKPIIMKYVMEGLTDREVA